MSQIERLTSEQIARFPEFVDRWTKIGLCTDRADRLRAEAAIRDMYVKAGLSPPQVIVWCGSPLSQGLTRAIILDNYVGASVGDSVGASVRASVGDSVRGSVRDSVGASVVASVRASVRASVGDSVRDSVRDSVWASVWDSVRASVVASVVASVRASVWDSVWDSVGASVGASVGDSVRDSVGASVGASVRASVGASVGASVYGAHDAGWLAFYRYFYEVVGLKEETVNLSGLWGLAESAGWSIPHKNICWVSERHHILTRDDRGRLHSVAGPACAYPDGWAIYAVHGVRVPAFVIESPMEISVAKIDAEANSEVRRVMIDRYRHGDEINGAAAFLRDSGGQRLDHDERFGTLWRRDVQNDEPIVLLEVVNSTREPNGSFKHYWLRVPPTMTRAHEASAWTFNVAEKDYAPLVET